MTKKRWKASMKRFASHIDPQREEELKWISIEVENNVKRIVKLIKSSVKEGNKDSSQKRRTELIQLVEDFHNQYQSLYGLYDNLRGEVRKKCRTKEEDDASSSGSSLDSESYFSPEERSGELLRRKLSSRSLNSEELNTDAEAEAKENVDVGPDSPAGSTSSNERAPELETESTTQKLIEECSRLKEKLAEKDEKLLSITDELELREGEKMARIKELEDKIVSLKLELVDSREKLEQKSIEMTLMEETKFQESEMTVAKMKALEDQVEALKLELKDKIIKQWQASNSTLQAKVTELETMYKAKEDEFAALLRKHEENEQDSLSRIEDLIREAKTLKQQMEHLRVENKKLDEKLVIMTDERSCQVHELSETISLLQQELESLRNQKLELERSLRSNTQELFQCHLKIEAMETSSGNSPENQFCTPRKDIEDMETERIMLQLKLEEERKMENTIAELENKMAEQESTILEKENIINKLYEEQREMQWNFQNAERKIDEMMEELRKTYEDSLRIVSRRIRVAEQLQTENKEWYIKTRETYERQTRELKDLNEKHEIEVMKMKEISFVANECLSSLDSMALGFKKCSSNFINRISSMSCEIKFAKEWVSRKHKAIALVKNDLDCLLSQLDEKEAEILVYREKVWKTENRVRELEKMVKQSEDCACDLKEEKREAIRQLCVWIDYHRSRCDYYKKMLAQGVINTRK